MRSFLYCHAPSCPCLPWCFSCVLWRVLVRFFILRLSSLCWLGKKREEKLSVGRRCVKYRARCDAVRWCRVKNIRCFLYIFLRECGKLGRGIAINLCVVFILFEIYLFTATSLFCVSAFPVVFGSSLKPRDISIYELTLSRKCQEISQTYDIRNFCYCLVWRVFNPYMYQYLFVMYLFVVFFLIHVKTDGDFKQVRYAEWVGDAAWDLRLHGNHASARPTTLLSCNCFIGIN